MEKEKNTVAFRLEIELANEGQPIPTEEDILNSIDLPDCYPFLSLNVTVLN